jgi:hypothetical protein
MFYKRAEINNVNKSNNENEKEEEPKASLA